MVKQIKNHNAPILLFDIDWTLLNGINNTHRESFKQAFKHCFNLDSADVFDINPHGLTDTEIISGVAEKNGIKATVIKEKMSEAQDLMSKYYIESAGIERTELLPGVRYLLENLKKNTFNIGIVSGNLSVIGKSKLSAANIISFFDVFCFPDTTGNKTESIKALWKEGVQNDIVIIGDTPNEILSAKATGSRSIAVATGSYNFDDLSSFNPDLAVTSFEDESVLEYLLSNF